MFVAIPCRLQFKVSESRHTVATAKYFASMDNLVSLIGNVKACICNSRVEAINMMKGNVRIHISSAYPNMGVTESDFILHYNLEEVNDNRFWVSGTQGCMRINVSGDVT